MFLKFVGGGSIIGHSEVAKLKADAPRKVEVALSYAIGVKLWSSCLCSKGRPRQILCCPLQAVPAQTGQPWQSVIFWCQIEQREYFWVQVDSKALHTEGFNLSFSKQTKNNNSELFLTQKWQKEKLYLWSGSNVFILVETDNVYAAGESYSFLPHWGGMEAALLPSLHPTLWAPLRL